MKSKEFITENDHDGETLTSKIQRLSKNLNWKIDVEATAKHLSQYNFTEMSDKRIFDFMREHGTEAFDEKNASLFKKVQQVHRLGLVNSEFYADEVTDALEEVYGDKAINMSLEQIAKFVNDSGFRNDGMI